MLALRIGSLVRWASLAMCATVIALPQLAHAQTVVKLDPAATFLLRAFYYAGDNSLLHIEVVHDLSGRQIQPLPPGFVLATQPPLAPPTPTPPGASAMLVSPGASYVVYFGPDPSVVNLDAAIDVLSIPLAFERLGPSASRPPRPIHCAPPPGGVCRYPATCHCAVSAGCCCS